MPRHPSEGKGSPEPGEAQHVKIVGQQDRVSVPQGVMLQTVIAAWRLQVRKEQAIQRFLQSRGAEQADHGLSCGVIRYIVEKIKAGIQIEIAFPEPACTFHKLQRRVHAFPDDERPDRRIRMVTGTAAGAGEDSLAGVVGEQRLYLQLRPVFPG